MKMLRRWRASSSMNGTASRRAATIPNSRIAFPFSTGRCRQLWPQFEAMKRVPVLVVRGANSDLLSEKTVEEMRQRHPRMTSFTVPAEGHAPLLRDAPTISAIASFLPRPTSRTTGCAYGLWRATTSVTSRGWYRPRRDRRGAKIPSDRRSTGCAPARPSSRVRSAP